MSRTKKPTKPVYPEPPPARRIDPTRMRKARDDAGLTQFDLSMLTRVSITAISRIENGKEAANPSLEDAGRLADALGVSLDWLAPKPK